MCTEVQIGSSLHKGGDASFNHLPSNFTKTLPVLYQVAILVIYADVDHT